VLESFKMKESEPKLDADNEIFYIDRKSLSLKGRVQSVITSTESPWAVRNVIGGERGLKTEPHLEAGLGLASENLLKFCYQSNIRSFIKSDERYLFLLTVCRNPDFPNLFGKRLITGFIDKRGYGYRFNDKGEKRWFVFGDSYVVGFPDAVPVTELGYNSYIRVQKIDEERSARILERFSKVPNTVDHYIQEIERLDPKGSTCVLTQGKPCLFEESCIRNRDFLKNK
jgi:hypothetical protein